MVGGGGGGGLCGDTTLVYINNMNTWNLGCGDVISLDELYLLHVYLICFPEGLNFRTRNVPVRLGSLIVRLCSLVYHIQLHLCFRL